MRLSPVASRVARLLPMWGIAFALLIALQLLAGRMAFYAHLFGIAQGAVGAIALMLTVRGLLPRRRHERRQEDRRRRARRESSAEREGAARPDPVSPR